MKGSKTHKNGFKTHKKEITLDKTENFDRIQGFLQKNWEICRWVALGAVVLEALVFLLALVVRAANGPVEYDSDDEYMVGPGSKDPLISRQQVPATSPPITGNLDSRPSRNDAWSTRMREKGVSISGRCGHGVLECWMYYNWNDNWKASLRVFIQLLVITQQPHLLVDARSILATNQATTTLKFDPLKKLVLSKG